MQTIYENGGRNFWVHNTGPLGCLPQKLSLFNKDNRDLDPNGCLKSFNDAAKAFNDGLHTLSVEMRSELKNATIVYVDIYTIKYDLFANSTKYGKCQILCYGSLANIFSTLSVFFPWIVY